MNEDLTQNNGQKGGGRNISLPSAQPRHPAVPPQDGIFPSRTPGVQTEITFYMEEKLLLELDTMPNVPAADAGRQAKSMPPEAGVQKEDVSGAPSSPAAAVEKSAEPAFPQKTKAQYSTRRKPAALRGRVAIVWRLLAACAAVILVFALFFSFFGIAVVDGDSMEPSISESDWILYKKRPSEIQRGDVLLFRPEGYGGQLVVKRVVGLPGDVVEVDADGYVLLNGERLQETAAIYGASNLPGDVQFPVQIQEGAYFVLGDNRPSSVDSRMSSIGQVLQEDIVGRASVWLHIERSGAGQA